MTTVKDIKVGDRYNLQNGRQWGEVLETDAKSGTVRVRISDGSVTTFGLYEVAAWINEFVLLYVCGICNKPSHCIQSHMIAEHMVNVHG